MRVAGINGTKGGWIFTTPSRELLELPFGPGLRTSAQAHALGRRILQSSARLASASAPVDDVLDAAAAGWSAHRIGSGTASTLPARPEVVDGQRFTIWY